MNGEILGQTRSSRPNVLPVQIIARRIDPAKLDDERYYSRLRRWLRRKVKKRESNELVFIHFIPTKPITERWMVALLLDLQREFTETLLIPKANVKVDELQEWFSYFGVDRILRVR